MAKGRRTKRAERGSGETIALEWVGGRLFPPFFVQDREEPYRVELAIWIELPSSLVVSQDVVPPEESPGAVARTLRQGLEGPLAGPPRKPERIRVANEALAEEVRAEVGGAIPVQIAPTPELDQFLEEMLEDMSSDNPATAGYLTDEQVPPGLAKKLYASAEMLHSIAPWEVVDHDPVLRLDIPGLDVDGACVSILGALGEDRGLLVFPSLEAFDRFAERATEAVSASGPIDLGTDFLVLDFNDGAEVPADVRRAVQERGWPVGSADAYPRVDHRERDGAPRPPTERDVRILTACASALSDFFVKHAALLQEDEVEPVFDCWRDHDSMEIYLTYPYEALELFEVDDRSTADGDEAAAPPAPFRDVGRNDPCPCGSGRKYKKCCLGKAEAVRRQDSTKAETGRLEDDWIRKLSAYAADRLGVELHQLAKDFRDLEAGMMLALLWAIYEADHEGRPIVEWFLDEHGHRIAPTDREWLEAQQAAWLSVWEVTELDPGHSVTVQDLLSGETRCVDDVSVSESGTLRDAVLTRVVDYRGISVFSGMHPHPLPPERAAEVVERTRRWLRRKRAVPVERLRRAKTGGYLIRRWEEALDEMEAARRAPRQLSNTDGDPLIFTTDHFKIAPGSRGDIEDQLNAMEGVEPPDPDDEDGMYTFLRPGHAAGGGMESTVIGHARLGRGELTLETNSRERADTLRERVEAVCGEWIHHKGRELADPLSDKIERPSPGADRKPPTPEEQQLLLEFKERYYTDWLDQPIPALDGKTPREAVQTAEGRGRVDVLLKDIENKEQRWQPETATDVSRLRRELGLE
jgi:hypothetical protein